MKICFFNRSYYPDYSATGQLLTELAEGLVHDHGCDVTVVTGPPLMADAEATPPEKSQLMQTEWHHGVRIIRTGGTTFARGHFAGRVMNYLSYFVLACLAGLRGPKPDVVIALTDPPIIGLAAWLAARRFSARFVFLCQDIFPEVASLLEDFHNETLNRLLNRINRFIIRQADAVVALGSTMRQRLIEEKGAQPHQVHVIHNWADCSAIVPGLKHNAFSQANGLADAFVVMHSGNVGLSQNLDTLLDAADRLRAYPDIVFSIIGDGVKKPALQARATAEGLFNLRFFPYQPKAMLYQSFASADVFVVGLKPGLAGYIVPSKLYGILAAGRPYVAAVEESCEVAAITKAYDCGLVAEPGDATELADQILTLYRDRTLMYKLGANARQAALEFDRPEQIRAYYDILRQLMTAPAKRVLWLKRWFDMSLSGLGLILSAPLWALVALCIKLDDGATVFYSQLRVGKDGKRFKNWKFRSMRTDSDRLADLQQAHERDPRITRIGHVLRATAIDELPQLWSIFVGDMSFVGPRALMPEEAEVNGSGEVVPIEAIPGYVLRHRVKPGLTGIAQIYAPRDIPRRHKFKYDLLYARTQSFGLDLRLIALSFWITFRAKWETRGRKF